MAYQRMTKEEKDKGLKEIFGLADDELESTTPPAEVDDFYDEPSAEVEEPTAKPETRDDSADMPPWMKVLSQRVEETAQEARAARQEAAQTRQEYQRGQQQFQQQQRQQPQPEPEEAFWADSSYVNEVAGKIEKSRQDDMRMVHKVALNQEWQNVNGLYDAYAAELARDPDMPKLEDVIPREHMKRTFDAFAANPAQFGGYGQNWRQIFTGAYQQASNPHLVKKLKDAKAQSDQLAKKREAKKVEQNNNLTKVARSGSAAQEPRTPSNNKRARREYRHSSVRGAALAFINSGD